MKITKKLLSGALLAIMTLTTNAYSSNSGKTDSSTSKEKHLKFMGIEMLSVPDMSKWKKRERGGFVSTEPNGIGVSVIYLDKEGRIVEVLVMAAELFDPNYDKSYSPTWVAGVKQFTEQTYGHLETHRTDWGGLIHQRQMGDYLVKIVDDSYPNISMEYIPSIK